jgi:hypothetical protein
MCLVTTGTTIGNQNGSFDAPISAKEQAEDNAGDRIPTHNKKEDGSKKPHNQLGEAPT